MDVEYQKAYVNEKNMNQCLISRYEIIIQQYGKKAYVDVFKYEALI